MKKQLLSVMLSLIASATCAVAQTDDAPKLSVAFDMRGDALWEKVEDAARPEIGFHGRYLNVMVDGTINSKFSYSWRQRMNKLGNMASDVFGATDWVYLTYQPTKNFAFSGGKQVVLIGGYEYDAAPIDIFFASRFWNNIECYQFGASASYISNNGNHSFTFQVCNSPYARIGESCFAYNLFWHGRIGRLSTLWSVNAIEYERGHFANFIALGNHLDLDRFSLELDLMNRATSHHKFIAGDYTVIARAVYAVSPHLSIFAKGGYDEYKALPGAPEHVDNPFYGGGLEFYPIPSDHRKLRIHAVVDRVSDNEGVRSTQVNVGLKWRVDLYTRK